jgi:hypothetical protein
MPARVREILEKVGDKSVLKIQLGRTPVATVILLFLDFFSSWKFSTKQLELGYDQIYHNYLLITIHNEKGPHIIQNLIEATKDTVGTTIFKLEKAHRVRLMQPVFPTEFVDVYDIPLTPDKKFTLNRLITTASNIDKHFYTYDAANNNMCQTFVENIVDINGLTRNINDETTRLALKPQDARALVATLGSRSEIVKYVTDFGGKLDKWVFESKIKWKKPLIKEFARFGNMHVKITQENTEDMLLGSADGVSTDPPIVENVDELFNAVVALEEEENKIKPIKIILIIVGISLLVIAVALIVFFIWRKRKGGFS